MSLLGRLEDLSLTDIVQIVYLSRRTGVLEIVDRAGRHTVLFRQGLIVNASAPEHPDLVAWLEQGSRIPAGSGVTLRQMEESGIPYGTAAVEMNLISLEDLAEAIRARIIDVVTPLLQSREGEFNFILSERASPLDVEYDADTVFREGGLSPQKIIGSVEGEKLKPLRGLEESLKAGKALLRGSAPAESTLASLNLVWAVPPRKRRRRQHHHHHRHRPPSQRRSRSTTWSRSRRRRLARPQHSSRHPTRRSRNCLRRCRRRARCRMRRRPRSPRTRESSKSLAG